MTGTDLVPTSREIGNKNLIPFRKGFDPKRKPGSGAPSKLDDPEILDLFAKSVSNGLTLAQLAETFEIAKSTAQKWKNDKRVKAIVLKHIEDRVIRITRKVDNIIEHRLKYAEELDTETLLKIRKEFLGGAMRLQTQGSKDDPATIQAGQLEIESNPEFAVELTKLLEKAQNGKQESSS